MEERLSMLAELRVLIAHLGEVSSPLWWPTECTTEAGLEFSRQNFPRSWASAAVGAAVHAAQAVHDERIGKRGTRHLFRFDGGLERRIHEEILHADQQAVAALIESRDTALENLRTRVGQTVSAVPGPVQIGRLGDETRSELVGDVAAHYMDGFERGETVFPYFASDAAGDSR